MARTAYKPTQKQLEYAYTMRCRGRTIPFICVKLKISMAQYGRNRKEFSEFYEKRKKDDKRKNYVRKRAGLKPVRIEPMKKQYYNAKVNYEDIDLDEIESYVLLGLDKVKIAAIIGISLSTLYKYIDGYPPLRLVFETANEKVSADVLRNLLAMCKDREVLKTIHASYMGEITTKQVKEVIPKSFPALKFFLANKQGWTDLPDSAPQDNRGSILETLDKMMNAGEESKKGK